MAYTRIHAIKSTVNRSVAYICNPDKTEGELYVSSFACSPKTAHIEFHYALGDKRRKDENLAFHLIQSFSPDDNVTPEDAHRIGQTLADEILEGKYSYVISTHTEKNHIHNHIIFCATDNIDHKKYNDCKRSYNKIRKISDRLCEEHNLSVITPGQQKGKTHYEWQADRDGKSYKTRLRKEIDSAIKACGNYEDFISIIKSKGVEVKGDNLGAEQLKYISFKPYSAQRFIRGSVRSLGEDYTRERIMERISERQLSRKKMPTRPPAKSPLVDTTTEKMMGNFWLKNWGQKKNIKLAAELYARYGSIEELRTQIKAQTEIKKNARDSILKADKDLRILPEAIKYAGFYNDNKATFEAYSKAGNKEDFYQLHETEIRLYEGADNYLKSHGFDPETTSKEKLNQQYKELTSAKNKWKQSVSDADEKIATLQQDLEVMEEYFGIKPTPEKDNEKKKGEQIL